MTDANSVTIEFHDDGPDRYGRRLFTLQWEDEKGVFRPEPHPDDGEPVGLRRGQVFRTDPSRFLELARVIKAGR